MLLFFWPTAFLGLLLLPLSVTKNVFTCTEEDGICLIGTYPDPDSCIYFHDCIQDVISGCIQIRHVCPPGFAFDSVFMQCALAEDAVCNGKFIHVEILGSKLEG